MGVYLAAALGFVALCGHALVHPSGRNHHTLLLLLPLSLFGLGSLVLIGLLIRPQVLSLDPEGFTLAGGLMRKPQRTLWRDIDKFFVYAVPSGGGDMVAYNYSPGKLPTTVAASLSHAMGADGGLPPGWSLPPAEMVERLNAYRQAVLGAQSMMSATRS